MNNREKRLEYAAVYRTKHHEKIKYDKKIWKQKWRIEHREEALASSRQSMKNYRNNNPLKEATRNATRQAVRKGLLIREACVICGATSKIEAHHPNYNDPMRVIWLCKKHHIALHKGELNI